MKYKYETEASLLKEQSPHSPHLVIHDLAVNGNLDEIKPDLLTEDLLCNHHAWGSNYSALELAAIHGNLHQVPAELIQRYIHFEEGRESSLLFRAIEAGKIKQFPGDLLSREDILRFSSDFNDGYNALHWAARHNTLSLLPKSLYDESDLFSTNSLEQNVIHVAAEYGKLDQIPARLLNNENLFVGDIHGLTVIELLAQNGLTTFFNQLPRKSISVNLLPRVGQQLVSGYEMKLRRILNPSKGCKMYNLVDMFNAEPRLWARHFFEADIGEMSEKIPLMPAAMSSGMVEAIDYIDALQQKMSLLDDALTDIKAGK